MQMYKGSQSRLLVRLTEAELKNFCLSFEKLCKKDYETKALLHAIINHAAETYDFTREKGQALRVDVLPNIGGGCFLLLTKEHVSKVGNSTHENVKGRLIAFPHTNAFLECLSAYRNQAFPKTEASVLWYRRDTRYFALLPIEEKSLLPLFSEFGSVHSLLAEECARFQETAEVLRVFSE